MNELSNLTDKLAKLSEIKFNSLPDIDLYMDQVLEYLSRQNVSGRDNENLTSAMINNYIKDGLLPRANDKKYSRMHLVYLTVISKLKQVLSVKDIGILLKHELTEENISESFDNFQKLLSKTESEDFLRLQNDKCQLSTIAMELAINCYVNKIACEMIIDELKKATPSD